MAKEPVDRNSPVKLGPIEHASLYPLPLLRDMTGLGIAAIRQMRRDGLAVRYVGGRAFVSGGDFISFVDAKGKKSKND